MDPASDLGSREEKEIPSAFEASGQEIPHPANTSVPEMVRLHFEQPLPSQAPAQSSAPKEPVQAAGGSGSPPAAEVSPESPPQQGSVGSPARSIRHKSVARKSSNKSARRGDIAQPAPPSSSPSASTQNVDKGKGIADSETAEPPHKRQKTAAAGSGAEEQSQEFDAGEYYSDLLDRAPQFLGARKPALYKEEITGERLINYLGFHSTLVSFTFLLL